MKLIIILLFLFVGCRNSVSNGYHPEKVDLLIKAIGPCVDSAHPVYQEDSEYRIRLFFDRCNYVYIRDTTYKAFSPAWQWTLKGKTIDSLKKVIDSLRYVIKKTFPVELGTNLSLTFNENGTITISTCGEAYVNKRLKDSLELDEINRKIERYERPLAR